MNQSDSHYDSGGSGEEISRRESRRRRRQTITRDQEGDCSCCLLLDIHAKWNASRVQSFQRHFASLEFNTRGSLYLCRRADKVDVKKRKKTKWMVKKKKEKKREHRDVRSSMDVAQSVSFKNATAICHNWGDVM